MDVKPVDAEHNRLSIQYDAWAIYHAAIKREVLFASCMQMLPKDVTTPLGHTDVSASSVNNLKHMAAYMSVIHWLAMMQRSRQTETFDEH